MAGKGYKNDGLKMSNDKTSFFSVDLQKVIMLPRLPGAKTVVFTKRIIAYNLTFAPLGDNKRLPDKTLSPYAVTWHEAEGERSASEIASAYLFFVNHHRDVTNYIFWADNCSAQNKNWHLFTLFTIVANGKDVPHLNSITMKDFEKGHTFMSADTNHHLVEKAMCEVKNVYDYRDFVSCLEKNGVY